LCFQPSFSDNTATVCCFKNNGFFLLPAKQVGPRLSEASRNSLRDKSSGVVAIDLLVPI
jgi:hypothetical protein